MIRSTLGIGARTCQPRSCGVVGIDVACRSRGGAGCQTADGVRLRLRGPNPVAREAMRRFNPLCQLTHRQRH
eukprot:8428652-Alexandrium_andersonii.AAC.1